MPKLPEIQTEIMPYENIVKINFNPPPDDHYIYELAEWMERVPGIISASPALGSIALRAAVPPFPIEACRVEAQAVAAAYFEWPREKIEVIDSPVNYVRSQEMWRAIKANDTPASFHAERHEGRELDPADLFIVTNFQAPERNYIKLSTAIMDQEEIYTAFIVDNGYGFELRISDIYVGFEPKNEIASRVINHLIENHHSFRQVCLKSVSDQSSIYGF